MLGVLIARGVLSGAECIAPLLDAGKRAAPAWDVAGLRTRLAQALADAASAEMLAREGAAASVRRALRPGLRAGAAGAALRAAALAANRGVLSEAELAALAAAEIAALRGRARGS